MTKILFIVTLWCAISGSHSAAQALPDTVRLSDTDIKTICRSSNDTLGFRRLTSKTSLKEYRKNRPVILTLQNIKRSLDWITIFNTIAGTPLSELQGVSHPDCTHVLRQPKYRLTSEGVILIGKRDFLAVWNDMATYRETIDCYFVRYNGQQTELIQSLTVDTRRPLQEWETSCRILSCHYPGLDPEDSLSIRTPPVFAGTAGELEECFRKWTCYSDPSIKSGSDHTIAAFTVNPDKSITGVRIIKALNPFCDHLVTSFIRNTKDEWLPGMVNGETISAEVFMSATFRMTENSIAIPVKRKGKETEPERN